MEFITQGNRIAVENFDKGKLYTILWKNDTQENLMCISIGADCVVFQGEAPINLFTLSMRNADTIDSIEPTQLGTTNYNNLINKPQINGVDLIGNKTGAQLGLASQADLEDYATNASVVAGLATKQDALSSSQLQAVNSGITSELVTQIGTNTSAIAGKQDALSSSQLSAVNSGITSEDVEQISTNKNNISSLLLSDTGKTGDLNDVTANEFTVYTGQSTHLPTQSFYYVRTTTNSNATVRLQEAFEMVTGEAYVRTYTGEMWSAWLKITNPTT